MTSIFLSYARADDEAFVRRLYADLTADGFTVWLDRESLISRGLTFHQEIKDAIRTEVDRVIYVGGPKAAHSTYVREEWQFALECDHVVVTPILRLGDYDQIPGELSLLHCEDFRDDAQYPAALAKLNANLRQPNPTLGALFAVPTLPAHFLARPELMRRIRDALLVDLQKPQVITSADARVGVQGMGGIGKSVLAAALARNREVRQSYPDGIVWISCGQNLSLSDRLQRLRDLIWHLGGDNTFQSLPQGQGVLRELLQAKAVLIVLDDVWHAADAQIFDFLGPRCRMFVTTRDAGILRTLHGELVPVSMFTEPEALQLLADAVGVEHSALSTEAQEVAHECGLLPLALALCGGMAKKRGGDFHAVLERLRRADLEKIADREAINEAHRSIWRAMQASVEMLSDAEQQRFAELAVFATDQAVPEAAAAALWSHTGDLNDLDTEELLINLAECSLIQRDSRTNTDGNFRRPFALHALLHDYAVRIAGDIKTLHQTLLDAYRKKCPEAWPSGPDDGYFFSNLIYHLISAARSKDAVALLLDFRWLKTKIGASKVHSLQQDFVLLLQDSNTKLDHSTRYTLEQLRNVVGPLRSPERLPTVIWGHFVNSEHLQVRQLLQQALDLTSEPWLRPITPSLASPNPALSQAISFRDKGAMLESLAFGDTVNGYPILVAVTGESPRLLLVWIDGVELPVIHIPVLVRAALPSLSEILSVRATNLPVDSRPALLLTWKDASHGNCCSLWDLSKATYGMANHLADDLDCLDTDKRHPLALGPTMILGDAEPISVASIAGRLVLLLYARAEVPWLVGESGRAPDITTMDEHWTSEWASLLKQNLAGTPEPDYVAKLNQLAERLSSTTKERVSVFPKRTTPARALLRDVETGELVPRIGWSLTGRLRPVLIGEDFTGNPFLIHTSGEDFPNLSFWRLGDKSSIRLTYSSWLGEELVLSRRDGRPVIVKGGLSGIEVVDATTCEIVGRFMKHLDNERLLSAGMGEDGSHLVASVGDLGTRGRFSTSVRIWDVETQTQIAPTGESHTGKICVVASGRYRGTPLFATGGSDLICFWSTRSVPDYSVETESKEISDPNICGRVSASRLPRDYRHHDLGAIRPLLSPEWLSNDFHDAVITWASRRSSIESLIATQQVWRLQPLECGEFRRGVLSTEEVEPLFLAPDAVAPKKIESHRVDSNMSEVVSVSVVGKREYATTIETLRRDGTCRIWKFSRHADWERQRGTWHYWHCVSIQGAVLNGTPVAIDVHTHTLDGEVTVKYKHGENWKLLNYDPGCPATQCALGEDGSLVIFDERGTTHYLELVVP